MCSTLTLTLTLALTLNLTLTLASALEADVLEDLHAVHAVHHHVAEHQVELLARRHAHVLAQQLQALLAAARPLPPRTRRVSGAAEAAELAGQSQGGAWGEGEAAASGAPSRESHSCGRALR